jgi:hypothetical protein
VSAAIAKALFQHGLQNNYIKYGTRFIVGWHGNNIIKSIIKACLQAAGMTYEVDVPIKGIIHVTGLIPS